LILPPLLRLVGATLTLLIMAACGGGGGSDPEIPPVSYEQLYFVDWDDPAGEIERLQTEGFVPYRSTRKPWPAQIPVDWSANPFKDTDWSYQLNAWRIIEPHLVVYEKERNRKVLDQAILYMVDWYNFNVAQNLPNPFKWYDASAGIRSLRLAYLLYVIDRDGIKLDEKTSRVIHALAEAHAENLGNKKNIVTTNHAFWQIHGWTALCRVAPGLRGCIDREGYSLQLMRDIVRTQFGNESVHLEHSPAYHFFVLKLAQRFLGSHWYDDDSILKTQQKIIENGTWLVDHQGKFLEVGDSPASPSFADLSLLPTGPASCSTTAIFDSECFGEKLFKEAGYATVRSLLPVSPNNASLLFFHSAFHSAAHRHSDDLSFVWNDLGKAILIDSGRFTYGGSAGRRYTTSSAAHNTIQVDQSTSSRKKEDAYGSGIDRITPKPWGYVLEGSVDFDYLDMKHRRRLFYRPREWLLVLDEVSSTTPRDWTAWFHFNEALAPDLLGDRLSVALPGGVTLNLTHGSTLDDCNGKLVQGVGGQQMQGWRAKSFTELVPAPTYGLSCRGTSGVIAHAFTLSRDNRAAAISTTGSGTEIRIGTGFAGWSISIPTGGEADVVQLQ
jgi:hypothetical protein